VPGVPFFPSGGSCRHNPRRRRILRIQGTHTHIIIAGINALNGKTLGTGNRNVNPVAIVLAPLRLVPDCTINFVPGTVQIATVSP
jgi:hypothetical protein